MASDPGESWKATLGAWVAFALVAFAFGSSFLWVKIAVRELGPFTLVGYRLLFGLVGLLPVMWWHRQAFPRAPRILAVYVAVAVLNTALPFCLISWGQARIDSSLAAILIGTMPLFTIVIAQLWLEHEGITARRLSGLLIGFGGVVVLVGRDLGGVSDYSSVWGQFAVLGAAAAYAIAAIFVRKYASPVIGLVLGTVFLGEPADWRLLTGSVLVMAGIATINLGQVPRPSLSRRLGDARPRR